MNNQIIELVTYTGRDVFGHLAEQADAILLLQSGRYQVLTLDTQLPAGPDKRPELATSYGEFASQQQARAAASHLAVTAANMSYTPITVSPEREAALRAVLKAFCSGPDDPPTVTANLPITLDRQPIHVTPRPCAFC